MKSTVETYKFTLKGGCILKKLVLSAVIMALIVMFGAGAAFAAPGEYGTPLDATFDVNRGPLTDTSGPMVHTTDGDNGLENANQSGKGFDLSDPDKLSPVDVQGSTELNGVEKNVKTQRVHGQYASNTNSCASCHQTHTASGYQLLIKDGIYNTCAACHDGTLGFYNVFDPKNGSSAGTFGGDPDPMKGNASVHLATGELELSFAPGGDRDNTAPDSMWSKSFTCASCHAPHGSYSSRLLHYNPAGSAVQQPDLAAEFDAAADNSNGAFVVKDPADTTGTKTIRPWVFGSTPTTDGNVLYSTQIKVDDSAFDADGKNYNELCRVNYKTGEFVFIDGTQPANVKVDVTPAVEVNLAMIDDPNNGMTKSDVPLQVVDMTKSYDVNINKFCGGCHLDYNVVGANAAADPTSVVPDAPKAYRHPMNVPVGNVTGLPLYTGTDENGKTRNYLLCVSCHYAHGTETAMMKDADGNDAGAPDVNKSSALKRYVNMSVCWKCHRETVADTLRNDKNYYTDGYLTDTTIP